jgi:hypothetical protein
MCERLKQAVLKTAVPERVPGVRIPLPPPSSRYCQRNNRSTHRNRCAWPEFSRFLLTNLWRRNAHSIHQRVNTLDFLQTPKGECRSARQPVPESSQLDSLPGQEVCELSPILRAISLHLPYSIRVFPRSLKDRRRCSTVFGSSRGREHAERSYWYCEAGQCSEALEVGNSMRKNPRAVSMGSVPPPLITAGFFIFRSEGSGIRELFCD